MMCAAEKLKESFFDVDCEELAKRLLGTILVRKMRNGELLSARIVETECYAGGDDKASHSFNGRRTARNEPMYMSPGTLYVYRTYGIYHCLNISSRGAGAAVLLRSLEVVRGADAMRKNRMTYHEKRGGKRKNKKHLKDEELCNGPSKLCISMDIRKDNLNGQHLSDRSDLWLVRGDGCPVSDAEIVRSTRIGIDSAGPEFASKLLRFYVRNCNSVSVRDKKRELQEEDTSSFGCS